MRHRGYQRAVVAVGHEILVIAHTLIARGTTYQELGPGSISTDARRSAPSVIVFVLSNASATRSLSSS
jgi:hypothetical protein